MNGKHQREPQWNKGEGMTMGWGVGNDNRMRGKKWQRDEGEGTTMGWGGRNNNRARGKEQQGGMDVLLHFLYLDNKLGWDCISGLFILSSTLIYFSVQCHESLLSELPQYGWAAHYLYGLCTCCRACTTEKLFVKWEEAMSSLNGLWCQCAGTSAETLAVVGPGDKLVYSELLQSQLPVFPVSIRQTARLILQNPQGRIQTLAWNSDLINNLNSTS